MNSQMKITIFGEDIPVTTERLPIEKLKYFEENPRVFSSISGEDRPDDKDELQAFIETKMLEQTSVKNLIPSIEDHGGLLDPILVRYDNYKVIEGNSRLAAFRFLYKKTGDPKWSAIPCTCVAKLTAEQQDAYLNQIHVKGKTPWAAYEKANFAYTRKKSGVGIAEISRRFSESESEVQKRIKAVSLMADNNDKEKSHFSYYDVLVRSRNINQAPNYSPAVEKFILSKIRGSTAEDQDVVTFKAKELRDKLPVVLAKKKELKKFMEGELTLDEAFQNARPSDPRRRVRAAIDKIAGITKAEVSRLEMPEINALISDTRKLSTAADRVHKMVEQVKKENA